MMLSLQINLPPALTNSPWIIGVSGGADSLALLYALHSQRPSLSLIVAHLNHGWRAEADDEAEFVRQTAVSLNLPCVVEKQDVGALAQAEGASLEDAGRRARYRFFARVARRHGAGVVAVAHHADDQAETVLMRLLRGAGLAGLRGMAHASPLPETPDLLLIRPLLAVGRAEIEAYCQRRNLRPVADPSNQDTTFLRNRLRHDLLPLLADYNPQIKARLQDMAAIAAADYALLQAVADERWDDVLLERGDDWAALDRARWAAQPLSLRRLFLRRAIGELRPFLHDISFRPLDAARQLIDDGKTGAQADLSGNLTLTIEHRRILIAARDAAPPVHLPQLPTADPIPLPVPGAIALANGWTISAERCDAPDYETIAANSDPWQAWTAVDPATLVIRPRSSGERFQPLGMGGQSTKVKKAMIARQIPAPLRDRWPLVANREHLLWIAGHQSDERGKATADGKQIVRLRCYRSA